jgi:hypothetical protein
MLLGQITPCGAVLNLGHPYPRGCVSSIGTLKIGYPRIQALSQDKEHDVHPRAAT